MLYCGNINLAVVNGKSAKDPIEVRQTRGKNGVSENKRREYSFIK